MTRLRDGAVRLTAKLLENRLGWSTKRRILVFESDDWGSARLPSIESQEAYLRANPKAGECPYLSFDCLEGDADLDALAETLLAFRDSRDKPARFTPNYNVTNPDFEAIEATGFREYRFEPFTDTIDRQGRTKGALDKIRELITARIWHPQSHGREHVHVNRWLRQLSNGNPGITDAFRHRIYGVSRTCAPGISRSLLASLDSDDASEIGEHAAILASGLDIFQSLFGYRSETFIAPNYLISTRLFPVLDEHGVRAMQGLRVMRQPRSDGRRVRLRMLGQEEHEGIISLVRNVQFEPTLGAQDGAVATALKAIDHAFSRNRPAIVSTHRVNYMGGIDVGNRERSLESLRSLLSTILNRWPTVEFMSSPELVRTIQSESTNR